MSSFTDIQEIAGREQVRQNVPAAEFTTFRTGGPADLYITPPDIEALIRTIGYLNRENIPYILLGRGSNMLFSDKGYRGAVVSMRQHMNRIKVCGTHISAEGGAMMPDIARIALQHSLAGFEFASGIPGTIGGGLRMNAGAYGSDLSHVVEKAVILLQDGRIRPLKNEDLMLSYRYSVLSENGGIVLSTDIALEAGNQTEIEARMNELNTKRREKQPLEYPSAGSTFKRPEGYYAGALVEQAGLKGFSVGGACVSEKHAGFVINKCNATSADIYRLTEEVIRRVYESSGVTLEREIVPIGEF